jgi:hypothetical protein
LGVDLDSAPLLGHQRQGRRHVSADRIPRHDEPRGVEVVLGAVLEHLEQRGLVRRARGAEDERLVSITLTDDGEALRRRAAGVPSAIQTAMGLDDEQLATSPRCSRRRLPGHGALGRS